MFDQEVDSYTATVQVMLARGDALFEGAAEGAADTGMRTLLLAKATAKAAERLGEDYNFEVLEASILSLVTGDVAVVTCTANGSHDLLAGVARVRSDGWERAVCRATLDSLNRFIVKD